MELHEAHEVKEVYSPQEATAAIQQDGWKLLAVTPASHPQASAQRTCVCYVLGKRKPAQAASAPIRM
ncbi:hypothetical protein D9M70_637690 [compost metagenome]